LTREKLRVMLTASELASAATDSLLFTLVIFIYIRIVCNVTVVGTVFSVSMSAFDVCSVSFREFRAIRRFDVFRYCVCFIID
jgi:hypothetical protein